MKLTLTKVPLVCFLFILINYKTYAQATDGLPATGNVWTAAKFLGWGTTSGDLFFRTNNTNRMVLKNTTGFVGIGTTTPSSLLHINGGTASFPSLTVQGTDPASGVNGLQMIASGHQYNIGVGGSANGLVGDKLFVYDNSLGQFRMVIDTDGNMGIYEKEISNLTI